MSARVLLVEDNPGDVALTARTMSDAELDPPIVAGSVAGALAALERDRPDVVLLDLNLPDADGLDALARVVEVAPDVPVIVLTGEQSDVGLEAVAAGAQDYLQKGTFTAGRLSLSIQFARHRADAQRLIRSHAAALSRANERLAAFVSITAHDLRAPLVNAESWTRLVLNGTAPDTNAALERVLRNLEAEFELIDTQLALHRGLDLDLHTIELQELVEDLVDVLEMTDVVTIVGSLPTVTAASGALRQVLRNLLVNAMVHARTDDRLRVQVSARAVGDEVLVRVDDDGPGIPPERRESVFDRGTTTRAIVEEEVRGGRGPLAGHGLGLPGARASMEAMGGLLWVEDGALGGAGMVIALPGAHA